MLEVCPKTIQRDIEFMRDQMDLPIEYDAGRHGFFYSREVAAFPTVQVTEGELVALAVAQKALEQYRGTPFERPLEAAFQKLTDGLSEKISFTWTHVEGSVSFRQTGTTVPDLKLFEKLGEAVFSSHEVEFDYLKPGAEAPERRRVQPYHVACIDGQWYLFGQDLVREGIRTFALTRMRALRILGKPFRRPLGFSIDSLLAASFGVFHGGKPQAVRLRFSRAVARFVMERRWHASQKDAALKGGGCELAMKVVDSPELRRWILSWGAEVEVLAPATLREEVRGAIEVMRRMYA
jgi:predicted DNA-binding transcriptional regulator YafY